MAANNTGAGHHSKRGMNFQSLLITIHSNITAPGKAIPIKPLDSKPSAAQHHAAIK